jgi:Protein of unknown function (DUF3040)
MLSHEEDRQLRAIEQWFEVSDPALTRMLRDHEPPSHNRLRLAGRLSVDVTGSGMFLLGAILAAPALVVFGFLFIVSGICLHLAHGGQRRREQRGH